MLVTDTEQRVHFCPGSICSGFRLGGSLHIPTKHRCLQAHHGNVVVVESAQSTIVRLVGFMVVVADGLRRTGRYEDLGSLGHHFPLLLMLSRAFARLSFSSSRAEENSRQTLVRPPATFPTRQAWSALARVGPLPFQKLLNAC